MELIRSIQSLDPIVRFPRFREQKTFRFCHIESGNCSCGTIQSASCIDPLVISQNTSIPGMFVGCLPLTSLRLSTLECFYNQSCLDRVTQAINLQYIPLTALDPTQSNQFSINTTLNYIIDNLMLDDWTSNNNYSAYFNECNLNQCTYSIIKQNNPLVIFTTLLGLCEFDEFLLI